LLESGQASPFRIPPVSLKREREASLLMLRWAMIVLFLVVACRPSDPPQPTPEKVQEPATQQDAGEEPGIAVVADRGATVSGTEGSGLRVRAEPSVDGDELAVLDEGDEVTILEGPVVGGDYNWYRVRYGAQGLTGWAAGAFLAR
jgi:hypothetical protein